ncbi:MAG: hypothetical protein AMJ81_09320 [Phycisphaerae bacterium SM23_33]|nr:MAG: hypothetical protein AMJ81_09320 [Phycisphaerae bacterium SM23_33]
MEREKFVKSSHILLAVALAWGGGIILLHQTYVRPSLARQGERAERENAAEWLRQANHYLRSRRGAMLREVTHLADQSGLRGYFRDPNDELVLAKLSRESLEGNQIDKVIFCDADRKVISAWKPGEGSGVVRDDEYRPGEWLGELSIFRFRPIAPNVSGIANTPRGLVLFARSAADEDSTSRPIGYVICLRTVDNHLFSELSGMVGLNISLQPDLKLPAGKALPLFGQVAWRETCYFLKGAQLFRDSFGSPAGYLMVEGEAKASYHHFRMVARALTITLLWAIGFSALMIMVIHMVVSGPTAKLVGRVERLRRGENVRNLSVDLRGEALVLARRFEEVIDRVEKLSQTDALTGLSNRRWFQEIFQQEFRRARRYNRPLSLAVIDIDFFKAANDALGHQMGDTVLRMFAELIRQGVRVPDAVTRLGGDEFAILMPETTGDEAVAVVERIRARLAEKVVGRGELKMSLTTSIGVADLNVPGAETAEYFYDLADQALYAAKRAGRNRTVRADDMDAQAARAAEEQDHSRVNQLSREVARLDAKFKRMFVDAIGGLVTALEARDYHTANHSSKVRGYALLIARQMSLPEPTVEHIARAAVLHDIGKIGLPDNVLLKEGPLDDNEWELVKRHPVMSVRIMEGMAFLDQEIPAVRYHHERYDGKGYPEALVGSAIPLSARILAVADAFDAMTSSRVYRGGMMVEVALEELRRGSGAQFDPAVVEAFLEVARNENITDETLEGALTGPV